MPLGEEGRRPERPQQGGRRTSEVQPRPHAARPGPTGSVVAEAGSGDQGQALCRKAHLLRPHWNPLPEETACLHVRPDFLESRPRIISFLSLQTRASNWWFRYSLWVIVSGGPASREALFPLQRPAPRPPSLYHPSKVIWGLKTFLCMQQEFLNAYYTDHWKEYFKSK